MPFFSSQYQTALEESISDETIEELTEAFLCDEVMRLPDALYEEFINSDGLEALAEAGKFKKNTLVRLNRQDDLSRRITMAAQQLAKEANDPLFDKLHLNRVKERELLNKINQKYANKAGRAAKIAQRNYVKTKLPLGFADKK